MPAVSKVQQEFMGAELRRKRMGLRGRTKMSISQLRDFAGTKRGGLPLRKKVSTGFRQAVNGAHR